MGYIYLEGIDTISRTETTGFAEAGTAGYEWCWKSAYVHSLQIMITVGQIT